MNRCKITASYLQAISQRKQHVTCNGESHSCRNWGLYCTFILEALSEEDKEQAVHGDESLKAFQTKATEHRDLCRESRAAYSRQEASQPAWPKGGKEEGGA